MKLLVIKRDSSYLIREEDLLTIDLGTLVFDIEAQKKVQKILLEYIGFSFDAGAVGETEHPFTLNFNSKDVRVTNHFYENDVLSAIFSAIHEGGHGIFEQNVNPYYDKTVAGSCCHMGIHESQSRFYENIAKLSPHHARKFRARQRSVPLPLS